MDIVYWILVFGGLYLAVMTLLLIVLGKLRDDE